MHREERDVEADEHRPEAPSTEAFREHPARDLRIPVVDRGEDREHDRAVQHVVEVRDHEVAVGDLPVERQHRDHHAGDAAEEEKQQEAEREQHRCLKAHASFPLHATRDGNDETCSREERHREHRNACREHVVHPHAEADEADRDERRRNPEVPGERSPREHRNDLADDGERGNGEDVDLGMTPEPEQMLVQQAASTMARAEEGSPKRAVELEQSGGEGDRRHREQDHEPEHEEAPHEDREPAH